VTSLDRSSPRWSWIAAIWLGVGLFSATQNVVVMRAEGMHHKWLELFIALLLAPLVWALATPLIWRLAQIYPPINSRPLTWLVHVGACTAISWVSAAWEAGLDWRLNPWATSASVPVMSLWISKFINSLLTSAILYTSIFAISYVLESKDRMARQQTETARLNEQLSKVQLQALRRQIEPHFLFNTLNTIAGLVREDKNDEAISMIAGLSKFLRRTLEDSNRQEVALSEEMDFVRRYLEIQQVRFSDRLQLTVDVSDKVLAARVPSLILQPMVENAFKHGISRRAQGGAIRISACRRNGGLKLSVYNDGPPLPDNWNDGSTGIGISNIRTRLQGLYGSSFDLDIRNTEPDGVEASVSLPYKES